MSYTAKRTDRSGSDTVFFTFHGTGGDETQFHGLGEQLMPGAHIVSPAGDVMEGTLRRYFKRTGEGQYDMDDLAQRTEAMAGFLAAEKERLGAAHAVGLGYSNGANILASVAMAEPAIVDRLVLMHPLIPFEPDPQPGLAGRKILVTAGRRDPICPAPQTEKLVAWFEAQGAEVETAWHDGGHEIRQTELDAIAAFLSS